MRGGEDTESTLAFELPSYYFPHEYDKRLSTRVSFDAANELLNEVKTVSESQDGTIVTSTALPIYQEYRGVPIKIAMITIIDSKATALVEGFDADIPIYNSLEDIPQMSMEEYETLAKDGLASPVTAPVLGNPADLSYVETVIEVYSDIEINAVSDAAFRIPAGGR
jgi:hypothetical protein